MYKAWKNIYFIIQNLADTLAYQYADHGAYAQYAAPLSYAQAPG